MSNVDFYNNSTQQLFTPNDRMNVQLQDLDLWNKFAKAQTEMIVTKTGRRMFPGYRIKLEALNPNAQYCVLMDVVSVDQHRYKFQQGEWVVAGRGEPQVPQRFYLHPNSPCSGAKWMKDIVTFHKVKLTNSCGSLSSGKFFVHSMHQYQTRIHVVRTDDVSSLHLQPMSTFEFPQTKFITVTAYQNHEVTKLKIENNPFARGFRENGGKTKNFEMTSSASCPKTKKRVPMSAAFQQIHKRWKNDVTESSPMTSANSWSAYQPNRQMSTANLLPNYYQPNNANQFQINHNTHQFSPNAYMYQDQVSPVNQQNTMYPQPISYQPQISPICQPMYQPSFQSTTVYSPNMESSDHPTNNLSPVNRICRNTYSNVQATRFPFPPVGYTNDITKNQIACANYSTTNQYTFEPNLINRCSNYQFANNQSPNQSPQPLESSPFYAVNETTHEALSHVQQSSPISPYDLIPSMNTCKNKFHAALPSTDDGYSSTSPLQQETDIIDFDNLDDLL